MAETLGAGALIAAPFVLPEVGAALGLGGAEAASGAGVVDAGLAADFGGAGLADFGGAEGALAGGALDFGGAEALGGGALSFAPSVASGLGDTASLFAPGADIGSEAIGAGAAETAGGDAASSAAAALEAPSVMPEGAAVAPTGAGATEAPTALPSLGGDFGGSETGVAAAGAAEPGSLTEKLGGVLSSPWTKLALGAAPIALALGMGETKLPPQAQQLQQQATALQQTGLTDLANARAGVLNAGQTATLGKMQTDLTNQWRQTLYNQGVQDPTKDARWPQIQATIDAAVTQQTATLIQQNITNALAETGQASTALTSIANMQFQADANFTNSLVNATKSLGLVAALSRS